MNKKGFTTIELLLTMLVVVTIMASITAVTYTYRDRAKYEETLTEVNDYKNMVTKIIYDDILDSNQVVKITKNDEEGKSYTLTRKDNTTLSLLVIDRCVKGGSIIALDKCNEQPGVRETGIHYNGID